MPKSVRQLVLAFACLGSVFAVAGCSSGATFGPTAYSSETSRQSLAAYVLRTNDQLHVQVYNEPTISGDYTIDGTGVVSIPIAGRVRAAGLTVEQLERKVTAQLNSGILKEARVNIQVNNYAPFYILGEVKKPGEFPYKPGLTIGDAVALAGGYTYRADESKAFVRPSGVATANARAQEAGALVSPGDNIRIPERFL